MGRILDKAKVKAARKERGLTQQQLARKAGFAKRTIENAESGTKAVGDDALECIAEALGVEPQDLLHDQLTPGHSSESRTYCDVVVAQCSHVDFRGLRQLKYFAKPDLGDVFVPVSLARPSDLLPPSSSDLPKLPMEQVHEVYEPQLPEPNQRLSIAKALIDHDAMVVLGEPGAGKSTLLRFLAYTYALGPNRVAQMFDGLRDDRLPIYVSIARYGQRIAENRDIDLDHFLRGLAEKDGLPPDQFNMSLTHGGLLLLLDGLDEIRDLGDRAHIAYQIETLHHRLPQTRVIVTSRVSGYQQIDLAGRFVELQILPLDEPAIQQFIERWSRVYCDKTTGKEVRRVATNLRERVFSSGLERLATNPLFLTIIAITHNQSGAVPTRREEIYRMTVSALAEHWNQAKGLKRPTIKALGNQILNERFVVEVLGHLAFSWLETQRTTLMRESELRHMLLTELEGSLQLSRFDAIQAADELLTLMLDESGLLVDRGRGQIGFFLSTIREYLAARYLSDRDNPAYELGARILAPGWREVVLFISSILGGQRLDAFIRAVLETTTDHDKLLHRNILQAARCMAETTFPSAMHNQLLDKIATLWNKPVCEALRREISVVYSEARGTWLAERLKEKIPGIQTFQLYRTDRSTLGYPPPSEQGSDELTSHLMDKRKKSWERQMVLAQLVRWPRSDTISRQIREIVDDKREHNDLRRDAVLALTIADSSAIESLVTLVRSMPSEGADLRLHLAALETLGRIGATSEAVHEILLHIVLDNGYNQYLRVQAARSIGDLGRPARQLSLRLANYLIEGCPPPLIRPSIVRTLGKLGDGSAPIIEALNKVEACKDDNESRLFAIRSLLDLGVEGDAMCTALYDLLDNVENPEFRNIAWYQLLRIANASAESTPS